VLWRLTPLSTIFQLYSGGQFYWWMKPSLGTLIKLKKNDRYNMVARLFFFAV
jgi:hypothetical protein